MRYIVVVLTIVSLIAYFVVSEPTRKKLLGIFAIMSSIVTVATFIYDFILVPDTSDSNIVTSAELTSESVETSTVIEEKNEAIKWDIWLSIEEPILRLSMDFIAV